MTEQKPRSIKSLAPKPSDAIKAMLSGLRELPNETFVIDMGTYGDVDDDNVCSGCAATCALFQLSGKPPSPESLRAGPSTQADYLQLDAEELRIFEQVINRLRCGYPKHLFEFYDHPVTHPLAQPQSWELQTWDWQEQLPRIEDYVGKLEAAGF